MNEFLYKGAKVYLSHVQSHTRKTRYNLSLVDHGGTMVSIDSSIPNKLVRESIDEGLIESFEGLKIEKAEYTFEKSRLDFLLASASERLLLEVKSCTLVKDSIALFPDAPTKRGSRHLLTLIEGLKHGRAAIFFLIQRSDASKFSPNQVTDPDFAHNLRIAHEKGVEVYAYTSKVTLRGVFLDSRIPIDM